jgi:hypothetical protein
VNAFTLGPVIWGDASANSAIGSPSRQSKQDRLQVISRTASNRDCGCAAGCPNAVHKAGRADAPAATTRPLGTGACGRSTLLVARIALRIAEDEMRFPGRCRRVVIQ